MRVFNRSMVRVVHVLLILGSASAFGGDGMRITINNNTTKNLLVTVYDLNSNPAQQVVSSATINGFASISVMVGADASGQGHLSWTATTVDKDMRMCGHHDKPHLNDGDTVHVYANSPCAAN
jgi:hypothetical protein